MYTLKAESRNTDLKPKQLRRNGIIPAVLYGKDLDESISIQIPQSEVTRLLGSNSIGSKVQVAIGGKKYSTLLRETTYKPATTELEHLCFQTLLSDEVITSTARVVLLNREKATGIVQHQLSEVSYRALPAYLVEQVDIDLAGMEPGDSVRVGDLDMAKDSNIEVLTPLDSMIVSLADINRSAEAEEDAVEVATEESE